MANDRFSRPYYLTQRSFDPSDLNHVIRSNPGPGDPVWMRDGGGEQVGPDDRTLIKEELRFSIRSKRIARGLPENVELEYRTPQISEEVSAEDLLKRERRRERNKVAAAKCRFKKKIVSERLQEESDQLEHININLQQEIKRLQGEKEKLSAMLVLHQPTCVADQEAAHPSSISNFFQSSLPHHIPTTPSCFSTSPIFDSPVLSGCPPSGPIFSPSRSTKLNVTQSC